MTAARKPDIGRRPEVADLVRRALAEDIGPGDATTESLVPEDALAAGRIVARKPCVIAGGPLVQAVFRELDPRVKVEIVIADGEPAAAGATAIRVAGPARAILSGERTALNFLQRLSGIATLTRRFVDRAAPLGVQVLDTRKTTPTLRQLEKYAVVCGGGANHRTGLYDRVLIKDNHRALWSAGGRPRPLAQAVRAARERHPDLEIEIEVDSEAELRDALEGAPDWILLDNKTPEQWRRCATIAAGRVRLEASGGLSLDAVGALAGTGVDAISIGALTHSAPAADLALDLD